MLKKRIQTLEINNLKLKKSEELHEQKIVDIMKLRRNIENNIYAQRLRKQKITNIKNNIIDLKEQVEYLKEVIKTEQKIIKTSKNQLNSQSTQLDQLKDKIFEQTNTKKWTVLMVQCAKVVSNDKINKITDNDKIVQNQLHTKIRNLPDDIIKYLYSFLPYETRIPFFEHKYKIYKTLMNIEKLDIFRAVMTRIMQKPFYDNISINCPNHIKKHNNELINNIWNRSKIDILLLFCSFIKGNIIYRPVYNRYMLLRRAILMTIVQEKYNNQ